MTKLTLINEKAQKKINPHFWIAESVHLSFLYLTNAHDDYLEEFILQTNICLPDHQQLKRVIFQVIQHETNVKNCVH